MPSHFEDQFQSSSHLFYHAFMLVKLTCSKMCKVLLALCMVCFCQIFTVQYTECVRWTTLTLDRCWWQRWANGCCPLTQPRMVTRYIQHYFWEKWFHTSFYQISCLSRFRGKKETVVGKLWSLWWFSCRENVFTFSLKVYSGCLVSCSRDSFTFFFTVLVFSMYRTGWLGVKH